MWNSTARMEDHQVHHGAAVLQIRTPSCATLFLLGDFSWGTPPPPPPPPPISHFTTPPIRWYQMLTIAKIGKKDHHWWMAARGDTNQCCRRVAYNMAKSIQITRVTSAHLTHLTKISVVNHKQLSNDVIHPLFYGTYGSAVSRQSHSGQSIQIWVLEVWWHPKNWFLEFQSIMKMVQYIGCPFACAHNSSSSCLPLGHARNLLLPHLPGVRQARWGMQSSWGAGKEQEN